MYKGATCRVRVSGTHSEDFAVLQGTKQGGKSSPILYLAFIDGLIKELEASGLGVCLYDMDVSSPTLADDMTLLSFSKTGLERMIDICWKYSCKWRYFYNSSKCAVMTFNDFKQDRTFNIGNESIPETDSLVHLGVKSDKSLSSHFQMYDASVALRGTYISIVHNGLQSKKLSPLLLKTLYITAVIPKALYGCETWNTYAQSDMLRIERAHRYCVKHMQSLSKYCNSDFAFVMLDIIPIELTIDKRKLLLLGQLCRLSTDYLAKRIFANRLVRYRSLDNQTRGFVPDIYRILRKYGIDYVLDVYMTRGTFPSKRKWKRLLLEKIDLRWRKQTLDNLCETFGFLSSCNLIQDKGEAFIWEKARDQVTLAPICRTIVITVSLFISRQALWTCNKCGHLCGNIIEHLFCFCQSNNEQKKKLWDLVLHHKGYEGFRSLMRSTSHIQCETIICLLVKLVRDEVDLSYLV